MSDTSTKGAKKKARRPKAADKSVLGSLPSTRSTRLGRHRDDEGAKPTATAAKPKAAAARTKPAKPAAKPRSTARSGPEAVRPSSPNLERPRPPRQGRAVPPPPPEPERRSGPPSGIELVTTAVQAAGEVAQIGLTVGGQILKRAVGRVPRR